MQQIHVINPFQRLVVGLVEEKIRHDGSSKITARKNIPISIIDQLRNQPRKERQIEAEKPI